MLEKATHATKACQAGTPDQKQSPFPSALSLQHPLWTTFNIMTAQKGTYWPRSIFTGLTETVNLDLRSNNWSLEQAIPLTAWIPYTAFYTHLNSHPTTMQLYFYWTINSYSYKPSFHPFSRMNRWTARRFMPMFGYTNYSTNAVSQLQYSLMYRLNCKLNCYRNKNGKEKGKLVSKYK